MADSGFIDLASFAAPPNGAAALKSRVIKGPQVTTPSGHSIEVCDNGDDSLTLIVRKKGDIVVGFDVVCACGRTSTVDLEYLEE